MKKKMWFPVLALVLNTMPLVAEELNYNLYQIQASASGDIDNDLMVVTLKALHQADNAQKASAQVNEDMQWALKLLGKDKAVTMKTEGYSTQPQYRSNKIRGWAVSQQLRLESSDFDVLSKRVGELQERLNVLSMRFTVKPKTRSAFEDSLMIEALAAYRQRAETVARAMEAKGYDVVSTNINTQGSYSPHLRQQSRSAISSFSEESVSAPAVESGETTVTVNVNGQVQLKL